MAPTRPGRYPLGVDQASSALPRGARIVPPPSHRSRRKLIIFAVIGITLALSSGGLYVYRQQNSPAAIAAEAAQKSPEDAVRAFLTAVFLANDAGRLAGVVCASWDPQNALHRTRSEVDTNL